MNQRHQITATLPRALALIAFPLMMTLTGCVGFSSNKAQVNNAPELIAYETASQVQVGDRLDKLKTVMGGPTSTGIDEGGKPYLRYVMLEQKSKATTVQILGFLHASTYNYPTGHELQIFYVGDHITAIARKQYVTQPGDNSQ